jgi:predicted phosphodiesterase
MHCGSTMRVAVLSDIHGNWFALLNVLNDAVREDVTQIWCLGDVVGYGPHSLECYQELRDVERRRGVSLGAWVAGNHDWGLAGRISLGPLFRPEAEWVLRQTKMLESRDKEVQRRFDQMCEFLAARPTFDESAQAGVWLMHGWVTRNEQGEIDERANITGDHSYIWGGGEDGWKAERSWKVLSGLATDDTHRPGIILAGHTHQPLLLWRHLGRSDCRSDWRAYPPPEEDLCPLAGWLGGCPKCGQDGPCQSRRRWGQSIDLPSDPVLINPGSVGQPRDGCPAAAYVILDFEEHRTRVTFKRLGYDVQATKYALARLAKKPDGSPDPEAMRDHLKSLRTALTKGEW